MERVGCPYEKKKPQIYSHATKNTQSSLLSQLNDFVFLTNQKVKEIGETHGKLLIFKTSE